MAKTPKHALTVLASPELTVGKEKIKSLEAAAVAQCAAVGQLESKAAAGAIMAGLTLHRVKASTPHGKFGSFIEQKLTKVNFWTAGTAKTNASYYMRLALAFVEKARADKGALLALPNDATTLDLGDTANAKKLAAALEKFVGDLSLTELLIKHNIKGVGLKTELAVGDDDAEDPSEMTPAQRATFEREQAFMEAWNSTQAIRAAFTDPDKAHLISDPKKVQQIKHEVIELNKLLDDRLANLRAAKV